MGEAAEALDHVPLDGAGRIDLDLPCVACGYNLRTGLPDGTCPECGASVSQSIVRSRLHFADPVWLRRLAWGAVCMAVWIGLDFAARVVGFVALRFGATTPAWVYFTYHLVFVAVVIFGLIALMRRIRRKIVRDLVVTGTILAIVLTSRWVVPLVTGALATPMGASLSLLGWWLLTLPRPRRGEVEAKLCARKVACTAITVGLIGGAVYWPLFRGVSWRSLTVQLGRAPLVAAHALGLVIGFYYLAGLVAALPAPRLARHAKLLGWSLAVIAALSYLTNVANSVVAGPQQSKLTPPGAWHTALSYWYTALVLASQAANFWALVLWILFAHRFRQVARLAAGRTLYSSHRHSGDATDTARRR